MILVWNLFESFNHKFLNGPIMFKTPIFNRVQAWSYLAADGLIWMEIKLDLEELPIYEEIGTVNFFK